MADNGTEDAIVRRCQWCQHDITEERLQEFPKTTTCSFACFRGVRWSQVRSHRRASAINGRLFRRARKLRRLARSLSLSDPAVKTAAQQLYQEAIDWRKEAITQVEVLGLPAKARPQFNNAPMVPESPMGRREYGHALKWWASKYSWDTADELPVKEASRGLIRTAIIGPIKKSKAKKKEAAAIAKAKGASNDNE